MGEAAGDFLRLRGAGAEEDRAPGGDPDRDPDLAEGVVDPCRIPLLREALEEIVSIEAPEAVPELARKELAEAKA